MFRDRDSAVPTTVIVGVIQRQLQALDTSFPKYVIIATLSNADQPVAIQV
jgi:hypothetical protein